MQDLNDMVLFAEVIDHGGFSAAGRATGIPKSRISRRMAALERELGLQLMHRSSRHLSLTPDGESFLPHCRSLRELARSAREDVSRAQAEPRGLVRCTCPVTLVYGLLSRAMPAFLQRYPGVRVDVRSLNRPVDPVNEGVDIALRVRPAIEDSTQLVARVFGTHHSAVFASPALLRRQGPVTTLEDLARLDTIAMPSAEGHVTWHLTAPNGQRHVHTHAPRYFSDDLAMQFDATLQGCGAAVLPEFLCREALAEGRLIRILPGWAPPPGILHAVYPARRTLVPAVRAMLDFLEDAFAAEDAFTPDTASAGRGHDDTHGASVAETR